jgi:hypothetical protein
MHKLFFKTASICTHRGQARNAFWGFCTPTSFTALVFMCLFFCFKLQIGKDGEIERLTVELAEIQKSKRQYLELLEQKDAEIKEKNFTIQNYLDKIVSLTVLLYSYFLFFTIGN